MRVLIVGAGIGGLAAARALSADGHDVTVFEQAAGLRRTGAAVTLWSNGTGVLNDSACRLDGVGAPIDVLETRDYRGRLLVSVNVARSAAHYGHPNICLPRAAAAGAARRRTAGQAWSRSAARAPGHPGRPGASAPSFADGTTAHGDLLVGADGRGSVIRDQLWGGDPAELTGWATWQGISPVPVDVTTSRRCVMFVGQAGSCGLMPAGEGLLQWWFDQRWAPGAPPPASPVTALRETFGGWAAPVPDVLAAVNDGDAGFFPHYRHRCRAWGAGRITVIGDAAHSMPPTRAQGANQALEDAWAMACALRQAPRRGRLRAALRRSRKPGRPGRPWWPGTPPRGHQQVRGSMVSRLIPGALASRYYTRWLGQISSYLTA